MVDGMEGDIILINLGKWGIQPVWRKDGGRTMQHRQHDKRTTHTMRGLALYGNREAKVIDVQVPEPRPGEIRIKVKTAGICGSDLHFYNDTPEALGIRRGVVIGHEPSGIVDKLGDGVSGFAAGDRVTVNHTLGCDAVVDAGGRVNSTKPKDSTEKACPPQEAQDDIEQDATEEKNATVEAIKKCTGGRGADCSFETSGSPAGQSNAVDVLAPRGKAAFVGINNFQKSICPEQFIHKEITLYGSKVLPISKLPALARLLERKNIHFDDIVTERVRLEDAPRAFARFNEGATGKFLIEF